MASNKARDITEATIKELFGLSGNQCANPKCSNNLIHVDGNAITVIGQICHIAAASEGGERYDPEMDDDQRRHFDNLILLCANCHKITNNVDVYTVEVLRGMKKEHEDNYKNNLYLPTQKIEEKILAGFAYDISYTEQEEWGMLEEIIIFVNKNSPKSNYTPQQIMESGNFTHISEKVRLNFPEEQRKVFSSTYVNTSAKTQTVAKFLEREVTENPAQIDELIDYIITKYREIKGSDREEAPIDHMKVIDELAVQLIPAAKRNSPAYYATAKAVVIQTFEYCHIGQKTDYERAQTLSIFI